MWWIDTASGNKLWRKDDFQGFWPMFFTSSSPIVVDGLCIVQLGGKENGIPRESGFDITVASECMAILALATDLHDLRARLGKVVVGYTDDGTPVAHAHCVAHRVGR